MLGIGHDVRCHQLSVLFLRAVSAEVDAAGEFPDNKQVDAASHDLPLQGRGVRKLGEEPCRPQVCKESQGLPDPQKGLLRPDLRRAVIPLGASYGSQQHAVGGFAQLHALLRDGDSVFVDGAASDIHIGVVEAVSEFLSDPVQDLDRLSDDLRADAVPRQDCNVLFHRSYPSLRAASRPPFLMMFWIKGGKGCA